MSETVETNRDGRGNNSFRPYSPSKNFEETKETVKQGLQYKYWCFTLNNYTDIPLIEGILKNECEWYLFQEEKGEACGTPHLQGTICLKKKQRLTQLVNLFQAHWTRTKAVKSSLLYCSKAETRSGEIYTYGIKIPEVIELDEPYGWQLKVIDIIKEKPCKRTIHWFWEKEGNVGKSELTKYLIVKHNALMLSGKSNDMYHLLSKYPDKRKLIVVDIPRSNLDYINYTAIECIKNGCIFSGKYDSTQLVFNRPHVIVFANELPNMKALSADRWNIVNIRSLM